MLPEEGNSNLLTEPNRTRQRAARRFFPPPWAALAVVGTVIGAALWARPAQTAWIYLKSKDGTIRNKIPTNIPAGATVQYVNTTLVSRDARGKMQTLVAWVPFVPIVTRSPREFPQLPDSAMQQLERIGCRIPQLSPPEADPKLVSVVQGEFSRPGQKDWAVLCATGPKVSVRVLWSRPSNCPSDFATTTVPELDSKAFAEDLSLDDILSGNVRSGEWLGVILPIDGARLTGYPPPPPPPMDHQAIEYAIWGKASTVFYCHDGRWEVIGGGD